MKRAVALLGEKEVQNIMEQEGKIEVSPVLCLLWLPLWHLLGGGASSPTSLTIIKHLTFRGGNQGPYDKFVSASILC